MPNNSRKNVSSNIEIEQILMHYLPVVSFTDVSGCIGRNGKTRCSSDEWICPKDQSADHSLVIGHFTDQTDISRGTKIACSKGMFIESNQFAEKIHSLWIVVVGLSGYP